MTALNVFTWRLALLARAKTRLADGDAVLRPALVRLLADADAALHAGPFSVVNKTRLPASGDVHDYFSYGPYWWPDPAQPDGLPYIRRDGEVNPEARNTNSDRVALASMTEAVVVLALAFYFTGEPAYAGRAALLLRTWFLDPATRMNPHLNYAQAIPGRVDGRGIGIIDTTRWIALVDAVGLLEASPAWTDADHAGLHTWFAAFLDWLRTSSNGQDEARQHNNHGSWYDAQVAAYALFLGQRDLARRTVLASRAQRIDTQIEADGSQPFELARTKSFGYSLYNLLALMTVARLGEWVGVDLWSYRGPNGAGIRQAIDFIAPYADPERIWPYEQIAELPLDRLYAILREAAYVYNDTGYQVQAEKIDLKDMALQRVNLFWAIGGPSF